MKCCLVRGAVAVGSSGVVSGCRIPWALFKCELIFCYWIFVQAREGSYKPSCDSCSNKTIPFGRMLYASANRVSSELMLSSSLDGRVQTMG